MSYYNLRDAIYHASLLLTILMRVNEDKINITAFEKLDNAIFNLEEFLEMSDISKEKKEGEENE